MAGRQTENVGLGSDTVADLDRGVTRINDVPCLAPHNVENCRQAGKEIRSKIEIVFADDYRPLSSRKCLFKNGLVTEKAPPRAQSREPCKFGRTDRRKHTDARMIERQPDPGQLSVEFGAAIRPLGQVDQEKQTVVCKETLDWVYDLSPLGFPDGFEL